MPDMKELKSLFDSPKKARITILCSLVALLTLGAVVVYIIYTLTAPGADVPPAQSEAVSDAPAESGPPEEAVAPTQEVMGIVPTLTMDEARVLALEHAGVQESQADVSREALSQDNGIWVYEFRFRTEQAQYEYLINANTGEVRSMVKETFVYVTAEPAEPSMPSVESASPAQTAPPPAGTVPPVQTAVPTVSPAEPSAAPIVTPAPTPAPTPDQSTSMYIGMERAKSIALEHAGLSADQVSFTHVRMEREHGAMIYEIEFRQGWTEYEYEIDAATGRILEHEHEQHHP